MQRLLPPSLAFAWGLVAVLATPQTLRAQSSVPSVAAPQPPGADLFIAKCSSCHSIGQGDRVGPDLKGVTDRRSPLWLQNMIGAPSALLDSDPEARALVAKFNNVRMPDLGLDAARVQELIDLLARCSKEACDLAPKLTPVGKATAADIERGRLLFSGLAPQTNGGPPCIGCHNVSGLDAVTAGGSLAKDLTHVFARLGDAGLDAALKNPAFPLMNKIFAAAPLTADEAFALRAFLDRQNRGGLLVADVASTADGPRQGPWSVPLMGALLAAAALVLLNALWARRLRGVRSQVLKKSHAQFTERQRRG